VRTGELHSTDELRRSDELRRMQRRENFPVAGRLLPGAVRADLTAVYDVARTIDQIGDETDGSTPEDRLAALDAFDSDLTLVWANLPHPRHPVLVRLVPTVHRHRLPIAPFRALIEANRVDQRQSTYPTWDDLRSYCALSADPVGRIVLGIFDAATPQRIAWSDDVCTALQVVEHCQDVAEDRRRGRVYLPLETLDANGVGLADLDRSTTTAGLRAAVARETLRCDLLLRRSGTALVATLRGIARVVVAGYVAGGLATVDALRRADFDVMVTTPRPRKRDVARHALRLIGRRS